MSTLYGTGQSSGKKQGLLAHIARSIVRNTPIQIFVPFDTIRDYLTASDAAARMVMALRQGKDPSRCLMQLVASEHPTTIAEILATFKRISRRTPLVVTSISRSTALYTRRVQFRSIVDTHEQHLPHTSLLVGIGQLMQAERFQFAHPSA
jgi:UDP-glucose 4-epimerase